MNLQYKVFFFIILTILTQRALCKPEQKLQLSYLVVLHFNDVYQLAELPTQPKAGAAYFKSLLDRQRQSSYSRYRSQTSNPLSYPEFLATHTLTIFSGDTFAPSLLSREHQGQNMVLPLNSFDIDLACFGNHQFDYNLTQIVHLTKQTNFQWLNSNVIDKRTKKPLADGLEWKIVERAGMKIGVFSVIDEECFQTFIPEYFGISQVLPYIQFAKKMVKFLREEKGCDTIFVLSHMRLIFEKKMVQHVDGIDYVFGGHDHLIHHMKIKDTVIVKSGSDFKYLSKVYIQKNSIKSHFSLDQQSSHPTFLENFKTQRFSAWVHLFQLNHTALSLSPDPKLQAYITTLIQNFAEKQKKIALYALQPLDLRFSVIRTQQSPYLTFISELFRHASKGQIGMINSGCFRAQRLIPAGGVNLVTVMNLLKDDIVVKLVDGNRLEEALENSVSMYPSHSGRYCQMAGVEFVWDPECEPGKRIIKDSIRINGEKLDHGRMYRVSVRSYVGGGADGFLMFKDCQFAPHTHPIPQFVILGQLLDRDHHLLERFSLRDRIRVRNTPQGNITQIDLEGFDGHKKVVMIDGATKKQDREEL